MIIGMIPRYFAIEARCIKINNGKHEFKIIYQQATSGLHHPPQANQQISRYQQEMQRDSKDLKSNNIPVAFIPESALLQ